jgi:hypothetical protein
MRRKLTKKQAQVLGVIINETRRVGCPPNMRTVEEHLGDPNIWRVVMSLQKWGYIAQPFPAGAWIPLQDAEGRSMRLELVTIDESPTSSEGSAPGGSPPLDPAGSEGAPA